MLDLATCQQLKVAGYPPRRGPCQIANRDGSHRKFDKRGDPITYTDNVFTCPNSDELIAARQARWPDYSIDLEIWIGQHGDKFASAVASVTDSQASIKSRIQPTPAAALAALYIALATPEAP